MFLDAILDPWSLLIFLAISAMAVLAAIWMRKGQHSMDLLEGGVAMLRRLAGDLNPRHPIRVRLESAPVAELSFEEISKIMTGKHTKGAADGLLKLQERMLWIERFAQFALHLGILGTVFALMRSDPTDLEAFRAKLPLALGTTFWGLIGSLIISSIGGTIDSLMERARLIIRRAILEGLDDNTAREVTVEDSAVAVSAVSEIVHTEASEKPRDGVNQLFDLGEKK